MLKSLFSSQRKKAQTRLPARAPEGCTIYAIGDIHGRSDLLERMIETIEGDARHRPSQHIVVIVLGDLIDRGPDSRGVISQLLAWRRASGIELHALRGNHEEAALAFLSDPASGADWLDFGGRETLRSYGVAAPSRRDDPQEWDRASRSFELALPASHLSFLSQLETIIQLGDYVFVHAGLRPGVGIDEQQDRDMLWIRDDFLSSAFCWDKVIVHGHTVCAEALSDHRRIGIDTGAYATGLLTAVRLEGAEKRFLQVSLS